MNLYKDTYPVSLITVEPSYIEDVQEDIHEEGNKDDNENIIADYKVC